MRRFLIFIGWASLIGSILDAGILVYAITQILSLPDVTFAMTVDHHLKDHLSFLYWVKDVAHALFPAGFVDWLFGLNAIAYFSFRLIASAIIGTWALKTAAKMS